ncbi:MAG: vitamin B12 dependent-methionine synthase activation domain-containing protein [Clostridiaceae bacterium]|nr:vitamin B12 dependent-methionine synthase activation domain-containing protein [Clostridiaceae bacterium]
MYIDRNEALRYMGYRGQNLDDNMEKLLDACINEVSNVSKGSSLYKIFDMERAEEGLHLKGTTLVLCGNDIHTHLSEAEKCAVMAVTLGLEIDKRIAFYSKTDLAKGLIFDACAAAAVESLCDTVQEEIEAEARAMGLETTTRYSPGYGDFSIEIQKDIIKVLDTYRRIGLSVNESSIMIPRKSVTAVIGMQTEKRYKEKNICKVCNNRDCLFGKDVKGND